MILLVQSLSYQIGQEMMQIEKM